MYHPNISLIQLWLPHQIFREKEYRPIIKRKHDGEKLIIIKMKFIAHLSRKLKGKGCRIQYFLCLIWFHNSLSGLRVSLASVIAGVVWHFVFIFRSNLSTIFLRISRFYDRKKSSNCCCWWFQSISCRKWFDALANKSITFFECRALWWKRERSIKIAMLGL